MDDKAHSADYFETASFAYFGMQGTVTVVVNCPEENVRFENVGDREEFDPSQH